MVIEWLKFQVSPSSREEFILQDKLIWTNFLSSVPGFLGKEVWISPKDENAVILVIRWQTREQWKSIPRKDLNRVNLQFNSVMKRLNIKFKSIGGNEFQVRKFLTPPSRQ